MNKFNLFFLVLLFLLSCNTKSGPESAEDLSDPTSPEIVSKQTYINYFNAIRGIGCISGQFIRWNYNASLEEIKAIHDNSGQWLGMLGADYYGNFKDSIPGPEISYELANSVIKSYYPKNGLVNLSVHFNNPQTGGSAWKNKMDFDSLLIENSRIQAVYLEELDAVAAGLDDLQKSGVMVMFRPFHEMNGGWFWWGNRERFAELWRMTYNYLVNEKELDNILWCWSPSAGKSAFHQYYPGDDYVDVVGLDAYSSDLVDCCLDSYHEILKYGKPFGFGEYGCVPGNAVKKIPFDYRIFLGLLKESFPETTYFLTWRDQFGLVGQEGVKELLNDPLIINREELIELTKRE